MQKAASLWFQYLRDKLGLEGEICAFTREPDKVLEVFFFRAPPRAFSRSYRSIVGRRALGFSHTVHYYIKIIVPFNIKTKY